MTARNGVLIVDDDPGLRDAIARTLSDRGYMPMAVSTAREALDRITEGTPVVALIDLRLEKGSGMDLIRAVKERDWPTECIVLTGHASQRSAIEAVNLGAYGYVQKPHDPEQLMMLIRGAFDKQRAEEMLRERTVELGQRLKELHCLYSISNLIQRPGILLEEILRQSVLLIPPAWRHSRAACARIALGDKEFRTPNFAETPWRQVSDIIVHGEPNGVVEVCYLEEKPASDEGPFSKEERDLIDAIAERLGKIAERKRVEEALQHSQEATARSHRLLLALSYASEAVQRARTVEEVYCTVLDEVVRLDYHALVFILTEDRTHLALSYVTVKSPLLRAAEELAGTSVVGFQATMECGVFQVPVKPGGFHDRLIKSQQAVFVESMFERLLEDMPDLVRPLARQSASTLELEQGIYAPLVIGGETEGILVVNGIDLIRDDVPAVTAFANQIAIAMERARLYQETRESEERFRAMSASAQDALIMTEDTGRISFWNEAAERIFGYSNQEAVGREAHLLLAPQRYHETYRRVFEGSITADQEPAVGGTIELTAIKRDGTEFLVEVSLSTVMLKGKWHVIGIVRDVTERKLAEEALHQYAAELEARNEELDAFAHTVAHDLKGPLGNVMGFAELLAQDYAAFTTEQLLDCLQAIVQSGDKMTKIINALLLLSSVRKIEEVQVETLDMASIVAETRDRLVHLVDEYQAEIIVPDTWPAALGYAPWVEEVWVNYVSNAIKYGGRPPRVELGATPPSAFLVGEEGKEKMVCFWVRDNGTGVSPEEQARLFTPFTRLNQIRVKGHGLGLSIVRRIVEKLGGQVAVKSALGQGSVFSFTLPADRAEDLVSSDDT
ncbi:MAG: PAS domain S-box protein [Anaerolineae bacterium]|nr:PAS domain S-box protein [Anaerolineae bacterium]